MKYLIKQDVVDNYGNRGTVVNTSESQGIIFYQVLFDKDWATGKAEYVSEEKILPVLKKTQYSFDDKPLWSSSITSLTEISEVTKILR